MSKKKLSKSTRAFIDELAAEADWLERERDEARARFEVASQNLQAMSDFVNTVFHQRLAQERLLDELREKLAERIKQIDLLDETLVNYNQEIIELQRERDGVTECPNCHKSVKVGAQYEHWSTANMEYWCPPSESPSTLRVTAESEVERVLRKFRQSSRHKASELTDEEINAEYVSKEVDDILVLPWEPTSLDVELGVSNWDPNTAVSVNWLAEWNGEAPVGPFVLVQGSTPEVTEAIVRRWNDSRERDLGPDRPRCGGCTHPIEPGTYHTPFNGNQLFACEVHQGERPEPLDWGGNNGFVVSQAVAEATSVGSTLTDDAF